MWKMGGSKKKKKSAKKKTYKIPNSVGVLGQGKKNYNFPHYAKNEGKKFERGGGESYLYMEGTDEKRGMLRGQVRWGKKVKRRAIQVGGKNKWS